jgi:four helix bundle protein
MIKEDNLTVKCYRDLIVWQRAMNVAEEIYSLTGKCPKDEAYGLTSQLRRAAVSIPSNIAEGQSRNSAAEFIHFISVAQGSRAEAETQLMLAQRLGYTTDQCVQKISISLEEIAKMLCVLANSLNRSPKSSDHIDINLHL